MAIQHIVIDDTKIRCLKCGVVAPNSYYRKFYEIHRHCTGPSITETEILNNARELVNEWWMSKISAETAMHVLAILIDNQNGEIAEFDIEIAKELEGELEALKARED